jgi:hypothetical protein
VTWNGVTDGYIKISDDKSEMIIRIPYREEDEYYRMVGTLQEDGYYQGSCCLDGNDISARWVRLGDTFVGTWMENGTEWTFSFPVNV